jgi:hypothetical protein
VVLEDGRHPVIIKTVDPARRTVTFDLIQWFEGDAAAKAADGRPGVAAAQRLLHPQRQLQAAHPGVAADAPITVNLLAAQSTGAANKDVSVTLDELAGYFPNSGTGPFWITVDGGQVTRIAQQYVP